MNKIKADIIKAQRATSYRHVIPTEFLIATVLFSTGMSSLRALRDFLPYTRRIFTMTLFAISLQQAVSRLFVIANIRFVPQLKE
jgi:hypothetical protein